MSLPFLAPIFSAKLIIRVSNWIFRLAGVAMEFLHGAKLTATMQDLCRRRDAVYLSIAYWGAGAIELLKLNPKRKSTRVLCCLSGGKSDPDVIEKFGNRARQNDRLHAKVIWTPSGALVGSANASSNGMPEEEGSASGLIEAGFYTEDEDALEAIRVWFNKEYARGARITANDLAAATAERDARLWDHTLSKTRRPKARRAPAKIGFVDALRRGRKEFAQQRIAFVLCKRTMSRKENKQAKDFIEKSPKKLDVLRLPSGKIANALHWYSDFQIPKNTFLIDILIREKRPAVVLLLKSLDILATFTVDGERITYVLAKGIQGFNYKLSRKDKSTIRRSIAQLWEKADGDSYGRVLKDLSVAAPILIANSR